MKKIILIAAVLLTVAGCGTEPKEKTSQEMWINGYTMETSLSSKVAGGVRFLFFDANNGEQFQTTNTKFAGNYYEYTQLAEDPIYTRLIDEEKIALIDGTVVSPVAAFTDSYNLNQKQLEVTLPIGRYYVVSFRSIRGAKRNLWNKYAAKYYDLEARYNPQVLTVVIPGDLTQYGCIPWVNWADTMYDF